MNHVWVCVGLSHADRGSDSSESREAKEILLVPCEPSPSQAMAGLTFQHLKLVG